RDIVRGRRPAGAAAEPGRRGVVVRGVGGVAGEEAAGGGIDRAATLIVAHGRRGDRHGEGVRAALPGEAVDDQEEVAAGRRRVVDLLRVAVVFTGDTALGDVAAAGDQVERRVPAGVRR